MTDYIANSVGSNLLKFPSAFNKGDRLTINTTGVGQSGYRVEWIVPATAKYRLIACGAEGGNVTDSYINNCPPGKGAMIIGEFTLNKGEIINIVVGQKPDHVAYSGSGGGGGTFIYTGGVGGNGILLVAGGGGGSGHTYGFGAGGSATTSPNNTSGGRGNGGSKGVGHGGKGGSISGGESSHSGAGGGAGWFSSGDSGEQSSSSPIGYGGVRFNGGNGSRSCHGGFGGGGGASGTGVAGGGGGGYSGGGGGNSWNGNTHGGGGGGGSYNIGENQQNLAGVRAGNGIVVIEHMGSKDILMLVQDGNVVKTYQDSVWKVI
ncbi:MULTISPECIES: hypothetical protein [Bacillus cereus group]|uniref:hypothetical protein n=1 Tax=Bacillus cereus group TaxID=86661 RepID=UPI000BF58064|nr:hypothetical protein [Bacillus thuringiensis]PEV23297.1 hypothetical protein CN420_19585 [Bacillus thuringiensis]PFS77171.1 hypothetical protein COK50_08115 [Bacillus thuringiensis]WLP67105.1 hypothetical protein Q9G86_28620 [Bacillus thuringiensis]